MWTPRIGPEAARLRLKGTQFQGRAWVCQLIGVITIIAGAKLNLPWLWIPGCVIFAGTVPCFYLMHLNRKRSVRAASQAIGMEITWRNYPPRWDEAYAKWCKKYNVTPYAVVARPEDRATTPGRDAGHTE